MRLHDFSEILVQLVRRVACAGRRCRRSPMTAAATAFIKKIRAQRGEWVMMTGLSVVLLVISPAWPTGEKRLPTDPSAKGETNAGPEEASPRLDLDALEQRLRETDAIGFFTKLALRSEINDLLDTFRHFHRGELQTTRDELWEQYYLLLFKVVSLLQDDDAELAQEIYAAREGLWELLLDPKTFDKS